MRVLFVLNKPERELETMDKIANWMVQKEPEITTKKLDFREKQFLSKILEFSPNIIFTFPFTAYTVSTPFYIVKYLLKCHIVCFTTEGLLNFNSEKQIKRQIGLDRYGKNIVDYELVWGEKVAEVEAKELLKQDKISSIERVKDFGYPKYEMYFNGKDTATFDIPPILKNKINDYPKEKTFFFVTGFAFADYTKEDIIRAGDMVDVNDKEYFECQLNKALNSAKEDATLRALWIEKIIEIAEIHPEVLIIVKSHPVENILNTRIGIDRYEVFKNYRNIVYISEPASIIDIMPVCSVFFHYGSTTAVEACLLKVPSVLITLNEINDEDLKLPFAKAISIFNLPDIVREHLVAPLKFEEIKDVEDILSGAFNITKEHLYKKALYLPSKDIANFLLSLKNDTPQQISDSDPYFKEAVMMRGKEAIHYLLHIGSRYFETQEFTSAITAFDKALLLAGISGLRTTGVHYARAMCLVKSGNSELAEKALLAELATNPNNNQAINLLKEIKTNSLKNKHSV